MTLYRAGKPEPRPTPRPNPQARPKRKAAIWPKVCIGLGLILMLLSTIGYVSARTFVGTLNSSVETGVALDDSSRKQEQPKGRSLRGPIDLLLLGLDTRDGWKPNTSRADTIMVLHVPATHDQAYLMSIPRDALVDIPPYPPSGYFGGRAKANSAFYYGSQLNQGWQGGAALTAKMINLMTGLTFSGVIVIDFHGFKRVIDTLGKIRMCVDRLTVSDHYIVVNGQPEKAYGKKSGVYLRNSFVHQPGCRMMPGWEALDFARQRKGGPNGDYDRQRHQQQLLKAMADRATSAGVITNPLKINDLIKAAGQSLKIDTGKAKLIDFVFTLKSLATADLLMLKTNGGTYNSARLKKVSAEVLNLETLEMFGAAANDRLGQFVLNHPHLIIGSR